jgi:hypothetical protein
MIEDWPNDDGQTDVMSWRQASLFSWFFLNFGRVQVV